MGQCTSKNDSTANGTFNQMKKSDRQLRSGVKFKDIEFGGFIGYSTIINDVYTPSGMSVASEAKSVPNTTAGSEGADQPQIENTESVSLIPK